MRRMHCAVLNVVAVLGFVSVASAADLPVKAPVYKAPVAVAPSWTGFYIGANVGGGWGNRDVDYTANDPATASLFTGGGGQPPATSFRTSGLLGGLQLGYNWQIAPTWLVGLETDFDWSGMKGSGSSSGFISGVAPYTATVDEHIKWFGTVRARLGYLPAPNILTYITGGFAYGRAEHTGSYNNGAIGFINITPPTLNCIATNTACLTGSSSSVAAGWTLGGGLEYAIVQNWTLKAEYLYVSLGAKSLTENAVVPTGASINANFSRTNFNVARVGLNYRF